MAAREKLAARLAPTAGPCRQTMSPTSTTGSSSSHTSGPSASTGAAPRTNVAPPSATATAPTSSRRRAKSSQSLQASRATREASAPARTAWPRSSGQAMKCPLTSGPKATVANGATAAAMRHSTREAGRVDSRRDSMWAQPAKPKVQNTARPKTVRARLVELIDAQASETKVNVPARMRKAPMNQPTLSPSTGFQKRSQVDGPALTATLGGLGILRGGSGGSVAGAATGGACGRSGGASWSGSR